MSHPSDRPMRRTRLPSADLRSAWEKSASGFIAWVRKPGHDSYWTFHRDRFLELVPPPGTRTLDLGCGEGRLSRDLVRLGHDVVGVDASPTMLAAAREAAPGIETHLADVAALPFADGACDCAIAFMSLQDVQDLDGALREAARVLEPGGHFCMAIVHPINSAGVFEGAEATSVFTIEGSYLDQSYYADELSRDGLELTMVSVHRPLQDYTEALAAAGFLIERLREVRVPDEAIKVPRSRRWQRLPLFLHLRAVKR
jgi:SAM-dependent methyltransferase